jgi:hypothetical protein
MGIEEGEVQTKCIKNITHKTTAENVPILEKEMHIQE